MTPLGSRADVPLLDRRPKTLARRVGERRTGPRMSAIKTAQDFVRALKAPNDPPSAGLPRKVQIAREGWDDQAFHVPNKAELIVDWLLGRFQKERNTQR